MALQALDVLQIRTARRGGGVEGSKSRPSQGLRPPPWARALALPYMVFIVDIEYIISIFDYIGPVMTKSKAQ
jgi:hypothetical protein